MSRVLVTGASGFIGSRAIEPLLEAGHEVHVLSRRDDPFPSGVHLHRADLLDDPLAADSVAGAARAEMLLHLAWYAEHGKYWTSLENVRWVEATLRLLRAFAAHGGGRAVAAGTCAEYDWSEGGTFNERESPLEPATLYGVSKDATRAVAEASAGELGIELAWGRVFFLYGPREAPGRVVPAVARQLLAGGEAETTDGRQTRDFMHVDDVARAFAAVLDSGVSGPVNIASGKPIELRRVIELVAAAAGAPDRVRYGAVPKRPGEPGVLVADVARLRDEVGFRPRVPIEAGIAATVDWWREQQLSGVR